MAAACAEDELEALIDRERRAILAFIDERLLPLMIRSALARAGETRPPARMDPAPAPPTDASPSTDTDDAWLIDEPAPSLLPQPSHIAAWLRMHGAWRTGRLLMAYVEAAGEGLSREDIDAGLRAWGYSRRSVDAALDRLMDSGAVARREGSDEWVATRAYMSGVPSSPFVIGIDDKGGSCPRQIDEAQGE